MHLNKARTLFFACPARCRIVDNNPILPDTAAGRAGIETPPESGFLQILTIKLSSDDEGEKGKTGV
ncbi:MAG: hypothetical protein JWQ85_4034 [Mucilaginibacter sp.]|nr:hypothetical protein [Mucilaginibacter sp.]